MKKLKEEIKDIFNNKTNLLLCFFVFLFLCGLLAEDIFIRQKEKVVFCDVGQGDGAFINLGKEQVVIDGGPDNKFIGCIGKYMPYFDRKIEYMIISHPDKDHFVGAVEVLKRYNVEKVFINGDESDIPEYIEFLKEAIDNIIIMDERSDIKFENGQIDFIYPSYKLQATSYKDSNDNSLVFRFEYNGKSILFTGDISKKVEESFLPRSDICIKSDILKISHHGSKTASSEAFLGIMKPELAIISVGENNFGHPSYRVIKNLERLGIEYKRTDEEGDIIINFQ
ncbi:ComEC/Rec2 family competence protein [Patescibacteria group bacterium]